MRTLTEAERLVRQSGSAGELAPNQIPEQAFFALEVEPLPARTLAALAARRGAHYCKHCGTPEAMPGHEC